MDLKPSPVPLVLNRCVAALFPGAAKAESSSMPSSNRCQRATCWGGLKDERLAQFFLNGSYMVDIWLVYGSYMVDIWLVYGWYMVHIWLIYGSYMVDIWLVYG